LNQLKPEVQKPPVVDTSDIFESSVVSQLDQAELLTKCWNAYPDDKRTELIESLFYYSLVWTVGAVVDNSGRVLVDACIREKGSCKFIEILT
jgi:hypothetical protein